MALWKRDLGASVVGMSLVFYFSFCFFGVCICVLFGSNCELK